MRVQQLAKLMRLHVESGELQERGCTELRRLVAENPENADEVANEALDAVVQAMELHIDIDGIQEMGCSILRRLSGRGGHEATVLQAAGVQVIRTMNMHASNSLLQEHCSAILHHCALGSKGCAELIVSLCGHLAVARAMHRHNKVEVQEQGCMALSVLASVAMGAESGGGGQILQAMRSYPTNMSIQHHGCVALGSMAFYFAQDQALIVRAGGVDAVVQAMRLHPTCPIIQEQGCMALRYFGTRHPDNQTRIGAAGGVDAVLLAMASHPMFKGVQEQGLLALRELTAGHTANQLFAKASRHFKVVEEAVLAHGDKQIVAVGREVMSIIAGAPGFVSRSRGCFMMRFCDLQAPLVSCC